MKNAPLEIRAKADKVEGLFRPSPVEELNTLIKVDSSVASSGKVTPAAYIIITVNLDEEKVLQVGSHGKEI